MFLEVLSSLNDSVIIYTWKFSGETLSGLLCCTRWPQSWPALSRGTTAGPCSSPGSSQVLFCRLWQTFLKNKKNTTFQSLPILYSDNLERSWYIWGIKGFFFFPFSDEGCAHQWVPKNTPRASQCFPQFFFFSHCTINALHRAVLLLDNTAGEKLFSDFQIPWFISNVGFHWQFKKFLENSSTSPLVLRW